MAHNVWRYAQYGVSKSLPSQDAERLKRATDAELCCTPRIAYDRMLPPGVYQLSISYLFSQSKIRSIEALLFPKKLVFRGGKKALADRQALWQFLVVGWLVRIAIVLGCAGWLIVHMTKNCVKTNGQNHLYHLTPSIFLFCRICILYHHSKQEYQNQLKTKYIECYTPHKLI